MRLNFATRTAHLSVGELASFRLGPSGPRGGGRWRLALGSTWHAKWQEKVAHTAAAEARPPPEFEITLRGFLTIGDWRVALEGRVDQVEVIAGRRILREIKTIRHPLPCAPEELAELYPAYFAQAALYLRLGAAHLPWAHDTLGGELLFIDLDEGLSQAVALNPEEAAHYVESTLARLQFFLEERSFAKRRLASFNVPPAFTQWREGQAQTRDQLRQHLGPEQHVVMIAPTGFGKTGLVLERALQVLRDGLVDRVIYATGRSTGQLPVATQLGRLLNGEGPRWLQLRSRAELNGPEPWPEESRRDAPQRWQAIAPDPNELFAAGTVSPAEIQRLGREWEIEPFALARALLPFAELWVADLNYVFSARHSGVFSEVPGFDPAHTLLIVDEAHHLPERVAHGWSHFGKAEDFQAAATEAQLHRLPEGIWRAVDRLASVAEGAKNEHLSTIEEDALAQALTDLRAAMETAAPQPEDVSEWTRDRLWEWADWARTWHSGLPLHAWRPQRGELRLDCLDAAREIGPRLQQFGMTLRLSATLPPAEDYALACGENIADSQWILGEAPWRTGAFDAVIDTRIDTRYRARRHSIPQSANAIVEILTRARSPVAVFFPSYPYAQQVAEVVAREAPGFVLAVQPRGRDFAAQQAWLATALERVDALFLVLGGSFAEGIDALGGRVAWAVVVGPALPEVNAVQRARLATREQAGLSREQAFRAVYQIPGLTKVNQALGRLVRAPGHRARVVLQCPRFAEPSYRALLDPALGEPSLLRRDDEWRGWLDANA